MIDIKLSATFIVPGTKMYAQLGNCKDANGKVVYNNNTHELHKLDVTSTKKINKGGKITYEKVGDVIHFTTPKSKPVQQVINMDRVAYSYFISNEVPEGFKLPGNDRFKVRQLIQAWKRMSKEQKITWHLDRVAEDLHGTLLSFQVLED